MAVVGTPVPSEGDASGGGALDSSISVEKGTQLQRLTALPVCEPGKLVGRQHPGAGRPFRVAKVGFDTFGEERRDGGRNSREKQYVRSSASGDSQRLGRRSGGGVLYSSFGEPGCKRAGTVHAESMESSARPPRLGEKGTSMASGVSENIKELVGAMRNGNKGRGAGRVPPCTRRKAESSFDNERVVTCLNNLKVPGCWLIDQAKAALEAGAPGRLSFATSSIDSVGRDMVVIQSHEPQLAEQAAPPTAKSVLQHVASFSDAKNLRGNRRLAMDYDAAALAEISIGDFEPNYQEPMGECPSIATSESESPCSGNNCKLLHRIPLACFLLGMALSAFFLGSHRKASGGNEASKELQLKLQT